MLNAVKSVLADVSSVSPLSEQSFANTQNASQHTLYGVQHIHINLTLIHCSKHALGRVFVQEQNEGHDWTTVFASATALRCFSLTCIRFRSLPFHVIRVGLPSQSASEKHNQEKKPTNLCAHWEFLKTMCLPCLRIIQSCYFDYTNLSHVLAAWSAFRALFTWSWRTTRAKDHLGFFILITHKSTRSENPITWLLSRISFSLWCHLLNLLNAFDPQGGARPF